MTCRTASKESGLHGMAFVAYITVKTHQQYLKAFPAKDLTDAGST